MFSAKKKKTRLYYGVYIQGVLLTFCEDVQKKGSVARETFFFFCLLIVVFFVCEIVRSNMKR